MTHSAPLVCGSAVVRSLDPAAIALENVRLSAELRQRLAELRSSHSRIVEAVDAERRRLERNLHDGAQQRLVAVALHLRLLQDRIRGDAVAEEIAATAARELAESLHELRELARGLHPAVLEHGLAVALQTLATRSPVPARVSCELGDRLPVPVELAAYFVACEALANVAKYASASRVDVRAWCDHGSVFIEISDDGVGGADAASAVDCPGSPLASRRSAEACGSSARRTAARSSPRRCRASSGRF